MKPRRHPELPAIAYVLNTYPQPSQSFIRREIRALETLGHPVFRMAMRRSNLPLVDAGDRAEADRTRYVLDRGAGRLLATLAATALRAPVRFGRALRLTLRLGRRSRAGLVRHFVYLAEACAVRRLCLSAGAEHVHAHFGTNAAAVAALTQALGGPRYSFTVHGPEEFDAPAELSLAEKIGRAAFVVAVSSFGRSQLCRWTDHRDWPKIKVVHCGIEPEAFPPPAAPPPHQELHLVNIGRFVEQKGQAVLIAAMAHLKHSHPLLRLTLVGDGPLREVLETAAQDAGLSDRVIFAGWRDEGGVREAIANSDALAMPSFAEGLPMVIMEAMAMARPVIATWVAGIPELVRPAETGWLVPAGDAGALAAAISELAETPPAARHRMGLAGRTRALARHDIASQAKRLSAHVDEAARSTATPDHGQGQSVPPPIGGTRK